MKIIKKIIFLFSITYCFILQSSSKEENTNNWYRKLLSNRPLGLPVSAIIGGSLAAGLKYVFDNNKFLSSFRVAEKIKHTPHVKFVGAGMIAGVGLYELLKLLTKPKQSNSGGKGILLNGQSKGSKEEEPEKNFNQLIKVTYICPGNLHSLLNYQYQEGLKSDTAREIENKISGGQIKKYSKNKFYFLGTGNEYDPGCAFLENEYDPGCAFLEDVSYAAALYLINENQKESFKGKFTEGRPAVYDLYGMKPTTKENLWCYALPLEYSIDRKGKKTYSLNISSQIKTESIDRYSFQLTEEDAEKIDLNAKEITCAEYFSRTN